MSSITRISTNKSESEQASEERKLEMQRRLQLQARGRNNLSLASLEELSERAMAAQTGRKRLAAPTLHSDGYSDTSGEEVLADDLLGLTRESARLSARAAAVGHNAGRSADHWQNKKTLEEEQAATEKTASAVGSSTKKEALQLEHSRAWQGSAHISTAPDPGLLLDSASHNADGATTPGAAGFSVWGLNVAAELDLILQEMQTVAARAGPQHAELHKALQAIGNMPPRPPGCALTADESRQLEGRLRFLGAFIGGLPDDNASRSGMLTLLTNSYTEIFGNSSTPQALTVMPDLSDENRLQLEKKHVDEQTQASLTNDLNAIYAYLEAVTAAAKAENSSVLVERFAKLCQHKPEQALERLTATGSANEAISLIAVETDRRFQALASCIEKQGKQSLRAELLKEALLAESVRVKDALARYDEVSSYNAARRLAEQRNEAVRVETTLAQAVVQKA